MDKTPAAAPAATSEADPAAACNHLFDEISVGDSATITRRLRAEDAQVLGALYGGTALGDASPGLGHGGWGTALIHAVLDTRLPGPGSVCIEQSLRFLAPVKTGARIRTRFVLADVKVRPSGWVQTAHDVTIEIEGSKKPALTARWLTLTLIERQPETA